jgi:hypothetical protein
MLEEKLINVGKFLVELADRKANKILADWDRESAAGYERIKKRAIGALMGLNTTGGNVDNSRENLLALQKAGEGQIAFEVDKLARRGYELLKADGAKAVADMSDVSEAMIQDAFDEEGEDLPPGTLTAINDEIQEIVGKSIIVWADQQQKLKQDITSGLLNVPLRKEKLVDAIARYENFVPGIDRRRDAGGQFRLSAQERSKLTLETEMIRSFSELSLLLGKKLSTYLGREVKYKNINPLDERTCDICLTASASDPLTEADMDAEFGLPPRHPRCRCHLSSIPEDM